MVAGVGGGGGGGEKEKASFQKKKRGPQLEASAENAAWHGHIIF